VHMKRLKKTMPQASKLKKQFHGKKRQTLPHE